MQSVLRASETSSEAPPENLRPPALDTLAAVEPESRLNLFLRQWCQRSAQPVVVFFDKIDALVDESLISVLRQFRDGYPNRPGPFPQCVALIGPRNVRAYKTRLRRDAESLETSSPFNIKVRSLTIRNFAEEGVAELYHQHTEETGQHFDPRAIQLAWELTRGHPWLVNAVADQIVGDQRPGPGEPIDTPHVLVAKEVLIQRRGTHLDSLMDRLTEPRVRRIIEPILAGELIMGGRIDDDLAYVEDLGLIAPDPFGHVRIANPIYREVIPRALAHSIQRTVPYETSWYVRDDGTFDIDGLLGAFQDFWAQHGLALMNAQPYHEIAPQLALMGFLQRIVNGGGTIDREYAIGRGHMDLCIRWPHPGGVQQASAATRELDPVDGDAGFRQQHPAAWLAVAWAKEFLTELLRWEGLLDQVAACIGPVSEATPGIQREVRQPRLQGQPGP